MGSTNNFQTQVSPQDKSLYIQNYLKSKNLPDMTYGTPAKSKLSLTEVSIPYIKDGKLEVHFENVDAVEVISTLYNDFDITYKDFTVMGPVDLISDINDISPGDILIGRLTTPGIDNVPISANYVVLVTEADAKRNIINTFPRKINDTTQISYFQHYAVSFPDSTTKTIFTYFQKNYSYDSDSNLDSKIQVGNPLNPVGLLQIGDIRFLVGPTQISFSTQNGYQYFPTIRTQGNPKVPTLEETKNINVSLIFPNAESINNQLLPLFAMYKRTPFVNIYNKDISDFFDELVEKDGSKKFLAVALESIHIQSVQGFPNTLQVNITMLPFQREAVNTSFKALKTFDDVKHQDYNTVKKDNFFNHIEVMSSARLYNKSAEWISTNTAPAIDLNNKAINTTSDFSYSEPFRAYYQSLLRYRKAICDETGEESIINRTNPAYADVIFNAFRPKKDSSYINAYSINDNIGPIEFSYKYIGEDVRKYAKMMSDKEREASIKIAKNTTTVRDLMKNSAGFYKSVETVIFGRDKVTTSLAAMNKSFDNFVTEYFAYYDINVTTPRVTQCTSTLNVLIEGVLNNWQVADIPAKSIVDAYNALKGERIYSVNINTRQKFEILKGIVAYDDVELKDINIKDMTQKMSDLLIEQYNNLNDDKNQTHNISEKEVFETFWQSLIDTISSGEEVIDLNTMRISNISGVTEHIFKIDNINDVITGWGVTFSNKFVPQQLLGFKYPFYQHLGSDDINLSLTITSLQNGRGMDGLKEQFSLLNDRIQNTTKIILYTMPELIQNFDKNIKVLNPKQGSIFNVFGLQKMIYNNSSISSIKGSPNAWSITANFTQDSFTLKDYQSVHRTPNNKTLTPYITNLLLRTQINPTTNTLEVINYRLSKENIYSAAEYLTYNNFTKNKSIAERVVPGFNYQLSDLLAILSATPIDSLPDKFGGINGNMTYYSQEAINRSIASLRANDYLEINVPKLVNYKNQKISKGEVQTKDVFGNIIETETKVDSIEKKDGSEDTQYTDEIWGGIKSKLDLKFGGKQEINPLEYSQYGGVMTSEQAEIYAKKEKEARDLSGKGDFTLLKNSFRISDFFIKEVDEEATAALQSILVRGEKDVMGNILKNILFQLESLYETEANILAQKLSRVENVNADLISKIIGNVAKGSVAASFIGMTFIGPTVGTLIGVGLIGNLTLNDVSAAYNVSDIVGKFIKDNEAAIRAIFDRVREGYVHNIGNLILRDPYIVSRIFKQEIIGINLYDELVKNINKFGINCYNDFDINLETNIYNDADVQFNFSPDFYLYQYDASEHVKNEYIKEELKRKVTNAQIMAHTILDDYKSVVRKLDSHEHVLFTTSERDTKLKKFIVDQITYKSTSENSSTTTDQGNINITQMMLDIAETYVAVVQDFSGYKRDDGTDNFGKDLNAIKFNMLHTARLKRILELKMIETSINDAIKEKEDSNLYKKDKSTESSDEKYTHIGISVKSLTKYKDYIDRHFVKYITPDPTVEEYETQISDRESNPFTNGMVYNPDDGTGSITMFEEQIFSRLHQLAILDSAIKDAKMHEDRVTTDLSTFKNIPEMALLQWYNWRTAEQGIQDIAMLKDFMSVDNMNIERSSRRLFPTQKIYFVETDSKVFKNFDDYYTQDAIESIDIVANKYNAGKTAVIRLGNVFNTLTDKMSLMLDHIFKDNESISGDNLFLGTLDIKPGTRIIIKQGYNANDKKLPVVFVGKIIEMRPGPITELICQSYGAQLNHYIESLAFGFASTKNEHGDVAMAILDQIPGLDGLGTLKPFEYSTRFSGRKIQRLTETAFEQFLVSNITSKLNVGLFTQDNPRDENIFLPIRLVNSILDKTTFDWKVYQQTVWQALGEMSLYHNNCFPVVKFYNNDMLSSMDNLRETLVIGNKAGYYKYTDSYSFSSINYQEILRVVEEWNGVVKDIIVNYIEAEHNINGIRMVTPKSTKQYLADVFKGLSSSELKELVSLKMPLIREKAKFATEYYSIYHSPESLKASKLFSNKYLGLILIKRFLTKRRISDVNRGISAGIAALLKQVNTMYNVQTMDRYQRGLNGLLAAYSSSGSIYTINEKTASYADKLFTVPFIREDELTITDTTFWHSLYGLMQLCYDGDVFDIAYLKEPLKVEEFLDVDPIVSDNTSNEFVNDLQMKKIQTHHLLTDNSDILDNNIVLSESFGNAIKVYYTDEPEFYTLESMPTSQIKKLKEFTVKAFGATTDNDTRLIESYQKNIDTNYFEIANTMESIFGDWESVKKLNESAANDKSNNDYNGEYLKKIKNPTWNVLPSFYKVAVSLLQRECEQMYRGTLKIVGNPYIHPFDIIHLEDMMNNMVGTFEVEEVIHSFNAQQGYITTIVPSMITYNRDPIKLAEVETMKNIMNISNDLKSSYRANKLTWLAIYGITTLAAVTLSPNPLLKAVSAVFGIGAMAKTTFDIVEGARIKQTNFLYDSFANIFGRDCINFSAMTFHGAPYMSGFGGVDYTNIKNLINTQMANGSWLQRLASANDREYIWLMSAGDPNSLNPLEQYILSNREGENLGAIATFVKAQWAGDKFGSGPLNWSLSSLAESRAVQGF